MQFYGIHLTEGPGATSVTANTYDTVVSPYRITGSASRENADYQRHIDGEGIRQFHKLKQQGVLLPHTMFYQVEDEGSASGNWNITNSGTGVNAWADEGKWVKPLDVVSGKWNPETDLLSEYWDDKDAAVFVQSAAARIYSQGWDALTFLSELHKTIRLVKDFTIHLREILANRKASLTANDLANEWLKGRYGWRQMMFDVQDINTAIANLNESRKRFSERAGQTYTERNETSYNYSIGQYGAFTIDVIDRVTIGIRGSVSADITPPTVQFNPVITGWELIPFSFVIDWFIHIGKTLNALSFVTFAQEYYASEGYYTQMIRTCTSTAPTFSNGWSGTFDVSSTWTGQLTRRIPTKVPIRPYPNVNLNTWKILDLQALFQQMA
jgi:hypothetical protein